MSVYEKSRAISHAVHQAGGRALIVGGWVRDRLLKRPSKDLDLEVYGVSAEQLRQLLSAFGRVNTVGQSFAVFKIDSMDVSLPRRESKTTAGHRGFEVIGDPNLPIKDAFRRRDFTINAIGWDPLTDEYVDPFHGRDDLTRGLLRAVDERTFGDDSLRVLRAIQLAARFEYKLDPPTAVICRATKLNDLPAERVWGEFEKLLILAIRPSLGFWLALEIGVIEQLFPELQALVGCPQEPEWHPEGDVWKHTLLVIDEARRRLEGLSRPCQLSIMLAAVCHDFGKPATTAHIDGRIRSRNHEQAGLGPTQDFLDRLKVHSVDGFDVRRQVEGMVTYHLTPGMWHKSPEKVGDGAFRRLARKVDLELLVLLASADCHGRKGHFDCSAMEWFASRTHELGIEHAPPEPLLKGRHLLSLGLKPGPDVGNILKVIYEKQLDGDITTLEEALAEVTRSLRKPQ